MSGAQARSAGANVAVGNEKALLYVLAGWLLPGLGHWLLGKTRRAVIFAVLILGSFGLGLAHDGRLALRDPKQPFLSSLQIVANLGVGPLDLAARGMVYGGLSFTLPAHRMSDSDAARREEIYRDRTRSALSNYGTAYIWTAGLMNLLLLFDVWDIARRKKA